MHSPLLIVIAAGILLGFPALGFYIRKALSRAMNRSYERGVKKGRAFQLWRLETLTLDLHHAEINHQTETAKLKDAISELQVRLGPPLTIADRELMEEIAITLDLALKTWKPLKGSQPVQARTNTQIIKLKNLSDRFFAQSQPVAAQPLGDAA